MIKNVGRLQFWEREFVKKDRADYRANLRLVEAMPAEADSLGIFLLDDPLSGIDVDIGIVKTINSVRTAS